MLSLTDFPAKKLYSRAGGVFFGLVAKWDVAGINVLLVLQISVSLQVPEMAFPRYGLSKIDFPG